MHDLSIFGSVADAGGKCDDGGAVSVVGLLTIY